MTGELSRTRPSLQLTLPTRDIVDLVRGYSNHVEFENLKAYIGIEIASAHRRILEGRRREIDAVMIIDPKFDHQRIRGAIAYMISMFTAGRSVGASEADAMAKGYVLALDGTPALFVERAAMDFVKGRVAGHDNAFTPTSAQVRMRAEELMIPFREERARVNTLLTAIKRIRPSSEEHARLLAKTRAVIDGTDPDIKAIKDRIKAEEDEKRTRGLAQIKRSTDIQRGRWCLRHGLPQDSIASPALHKLMQEPAE